MLEDVCLTIFMSRGAPSPCPAPICCELVIGAHRPIVKVFFHPDAFFQVEMTLVGEISNPSFFPDSRKICAERAK